MFIIYICLDDLSVNLKECPTGYIAGGTFVNHLMYYADDIIIITESVGDCSFCTVTIQLL